MALIGRQKQRHGRPVLARVVGWAAGLASICASGGLLAGPDQAQQLFNQGVEAARVNHWSEARDAFDRAYRLSARPVVLINLAAADVHTGRLKEAATDYRRVLQVDPSQDSGPFRKAAADVLPALEARIPRIRLHTTGLGRADVVEIDGAEIGSAEIDEPHPVDPGSHVVAIKRAGIERMRVSFSVAEGELHEISVPAPLDPVNLNAPEVIPPFIPGAELESGQPSSSRARRSLWRSPWFWTGVAAAVVGATVTSVLVARNHDQPFSGNLSPGTYTVQ